MFLEALPPELKMKIASHLQLRELILLRNASRCWQTLINNNLSLIRRARRNLLCLWDDTVRSPYFLPTRHRVMTSLYSFDRSQYLASTAGDLPLPEEFELWVLEWPAKAVIGWTWPGLDGGVTTFGCGCEHIPQDPWWQLYGRNELCTGPYRKHSLYIWDRNTRGANNTEVWREHRDFGDGSQEELHQKMVNHDAGVAIPVWSTDPDFISGQGCQLRYMLIISGHGPSYGSVQPLSFRYNADIGTHLDEDIWHDGVWMQSETRGIIRAASWVEWLRGQLDILETEYKRVECSLDEEFWDWVSGHEEFIFRMVDLEHQPKTYSRCSPGSKSKLASDIVEEVCEARDKNFHDLVEAGISSS